MQEEGSEFEQTIAFLELQTQEMEDEVQNSLEEVQGKRQFPCDLCDKVCKSKGGLTRHKRSKHADVNGESSAAASPNSTIIDSDKVRALISKIGQYLNDEKIYKECDIEAVKKLEPSESFVKFVNGVLSKFKRRKNHNKLLKEFYGKTNANWEEYFPSKNRKIVFLMLIHLPERLVNFVEESLTENVEKVVNVSIPPEETGPLSYLIGYVVRSLYRKSKNCPQWHSQRNKEIQALMMSTKTEIANEYIDSISRGGLWTPHPWVVSIAEVCELTFRNNTNADRISHLPAETMMNEVLSSALVKSLWDNIVQNCDTEISKECQSLCLENIIKLYIQVRCFSYAKDIINKYKISEKLSRKKALRKELKKSEEEK